jgi:hypothetical protein
MATYSLSFSFSSARVGLYARPAPGSGPFPKTPADDAPSSGPTASRPEDRRPKLRTAPRRHPFPALSDSADVADRMVDGWEREFAAQGGSRKDFVGKVRQRMARWKSAAGSGSSREEGSLDAFREEAYAAVMRALEAWGRPFEGPSAQGVAGA